VAGRRVVSHSAALIRGATERISSSAEELCALIQFIFVEHRGLALNTGADTNE
jgi:hypothetical protein